MQRSSISPLQENNASAASKDAFFSALSSASENRSLQSGVSLCFLFLCFGKFCHLESKKKRRKDAASEYASAAKIRRLHKESPRY